MPTSAEQVTELDDRFFAALLAADHEGLAMLLANDFVIVDVLSGGLNGRDALVEGLKSGALRFLAVERDLTQRRVLVREGAGVVVGRTRMTMEFQGSVGTVESRYTHVFAAADVEWQMLCAQGTPVTE